MRRRNAPLHGFILSLALIVATASMALAQGHWRGSATLGVAIKNSKGAPVEDALVTIAYRDVGFGDGPAPRRTNSRGEANFTGIAPGTWSLKIDHRDHLSYLATVVVRKGKKPQVLTEFLEATGSGRLTMRVKQLKDVATDRGTPVEPILEAAARPAPDRRRPVEPQQPNESAPAIQTPTSQLPEVPAARSAAEVQVADEPTVNATAQPPDVAPPPLPTPAQTPAAEPVLPASEAELPPSQVPEPGVRDVEPPVPAPEAAPVTIPAPAPQLPTPAPQIPAPELQSPPPDRRALRSYRDRTCFECKPGEWSVAATITVEAAQPIPCANPAEVRVRDLMKQLAAEQGDRLAGYGGPLSTDVSELPNELQQLASGSCRLAAVVLPRGARFTGFRFLAADQEGGGDCVGDQECTIGSARWLFNPGISKSDGATVVFSVFQNGSTSRQRTATLTAYFVPPGSWSSGL